MHIDPTTLFLVWFGGGFVIFLAWAGLVGQALMGERPQVVRPAIGALALIGLLHPAAAASAVDLVRLGRTVDTVPPLPSGAVAAVYGAAAVSVVVAVAAFFEAGGFP